MKPWFLLLLCLFAYSLTASGEINVGLLISKGAKHGQNAYCMEGFYLELAARVAVENVNSEASLIPGHKLVLDIRDIYKDRFETLRVTRELITSHMNSTTENPIAAIIGAADDDLNELIQLTSKQFVVPQISFESHSTELSNTELYPMFARMSASQDLVSTSVIELIKKFRWQRFNIIAPDDSNGSNAVEELKRAIRRMSAEFRDYIILGSTIRYPSAMSLPISESDMITVTANLDTLKKSGNRINILCADPTQAAAFLYAASQRGMTGVGWVYLGTDWNTAQTYAGLSSAYKDVVKNAMDGMVGISPYIGNVDEFDVYFNNYVKQHPEFLTEVRTTCQSEFVINKELYPEYTIFVYDAILTVAHAISSILSVQSNVTFATETERQALYDAILKVDTQGTSGHIHFKEGVGDRLPIKMEVVNIRKGQIIDIGDADFTTQDSYNFIIDTVPHWPGGSTAVPTDRYDTNEEYLALYMTLTLLWMAVAFIFGGLLEYWNVHRLPESGAVVIFGIIAGLLIRFLGEDVSSTAVFDPSAFTLFLLPIIIFESGYNMKTKGIFFKNIGTIFIYAIFGALFSALATGGLLSALFSTKMFGNIVFSPMECMIFGSLIAATDPVSTLAVFGALSVEPMLSMIIYGESVINDAVSIVMFNTMSKFLLTPMSIGAVFSAIWTFIVMFVGSTILGAVIALVSCLVLKYNKHSTMIVDTILVFLSAYLAYEMTEACELSGITATLACGIIMNYFGLRNMSKNSRDFSQNAVKVASSVADTLIFFQVGENVFLTESIKDVPWVLVISVFVIINIVRIIMVFGFTYLINLKRTKSKISYRSQIMMVHAGLRGAIAYSLAVVFPSHNKNDVTRVTMWIVILTIFTQGCSTYDMLHLLDIPLHCNYDTEASDGSTRHKRSVMSMDGSVAGKLMAWFEKSVIPFFTKDESTLEESLLSNELDRPITPMEEAPPRNSFTTSPRISRWSSNSALTRVVKGKDGKAVVHNMTDVEVDTLADEKDMFVISDDEVEADLHNTPQSAKEGLRRSANSSGSFRSVGSSHH